MIGEDVLRELSEVYALKPTFLSVYLDCPGGRYSRKFVDRRLRECRKALEGDRELRNAFDDNVEALEEYLSDEDVKERGVALFFSRDEGYSRAFQLPVKVDDLVVVDTSPYIRPLALIEEEYEDMAIVVVDHSNARMFVVTASRVQKSDELHKDIFHKHKKGGWSQMRYQRIRKGNILHFFKETAEHLVTLLEKEDVRRIIIAGPQVGKNEFMEYIPQHITDRVIGVIDTDIDIPEQQLLREAYGVFWAKEREEETQMVQDLRKGILTDGLVAYGVDDTLEAVVHGKAKLVLINKGFKEAGWKCEHCQVFDKGVVGKCRYCSRQTYQVDVVEEMIEEAHQMGTDLEFVETDDMLGMLGGIAAFLRYR